MFSFGRLFRITIFGESHGYGVGVVIDGCPAGIKINEDDIQRELDKRRSKDLISTPRHELDRVKILSGVFNGYTTGGPICILVANEDVDSSYYELIKYVPRPGHADYVAHLKYGGFNDFRGGGFFSGRITVGMVAAGAIALKLLNHLGIRVIAHTIRVGNIGLDYVDVSKIPNLEELVESNPMGCIDSKVADEMLKLIKDISARGDSIGGIAEVVVFNLPPGVGEPLFDTLEGDLAKAYFSIPGVKGVEFGAGFKSAYMTGSQYNDQYVIRDGKVVTATNNSGGIQGGISNGMPVVCRVVFRPPSSIKIPQKSVDLRDLREVELRINGRFDPCILPRALPVLKSMTAIVLADHLIRSNLIPRVIK